MWDSNPHIRVITRYSTFALIGWQESYLVIVSINFDSLFVQSSTHIQQRTHSLFVPLMHIFQGLGVKRKQTKQTLHQTYSGQQFVEQSKARNKGSVNSLFSSKFYESSTNHELKENNNNEAQTMNWK